MLWIAQPEHLWGSWPERDFLCYSNVIYGNAVPYRQGIVCPWQTAQQFPKALAWTMGQGHVARPRGTSATPTSSLSSQLAGPVDSSNTEGATVSAGCRSHAHNWAHRQEPNRAQPELPASYVWCLDAGDWSGPRGAGETTCSHDVLN